MKLTVNSGLSTEAGTVRAKSPSMPVVVPTVVPLIRTVAPIMPRPPESFTTPEMADGFAATMRFDNTMFGTVIS